MSTADRIARRLRRFPWAVNVTQTFGGPNMTVVDFDIGFGSASMRVEGGRDAEILGSSIVARDQQDKVERFTIRLPPVPAAEYDEDELRSIVERAVEAAPDTGSPIDVEINAETRFDEEPTEWTPHLVSHGLGLHEPDAVMEMLQSVYDDYKDAVFDPTLGDFAAPSTPPLGSDEQSFAAPPVADEADLFHVTRGKDARDIAADGLLRRSPTMADKRVQEETPDDARPMEMVEESREQKTNRQFDELMMDARRAVDSSLPSHHNQDAVFAWAEERHATAIADQGRVVVAIDSRKLPSGCQPVKGPISVSDEIYQGLWEMNSPQRMFDMEREEELYEVALDYWEQVEPYSYGEGDEPFRKAEVWMPCDVPPEAIEAIYDPETNRVVYEPADADQATLRDFDAARR